jgi:capsular polysaccharide export protein
VLKHMDKVYVATSLMGFEALMLGKPVVCFGMPFYAGWGLTDDRVGCLRRSRQRSVLEVFAGAYVLYSRYVNPVTGRRCGILEALAFLIREARFHRLNRGEIFCFGIRHWKRCNVLPYLRSSHNGPDSREAHRSWYGGHAVPQDSRICCISAARTRSIWRTVSYARWGSAPIW